MDLEDASRAVVELYRYSDSHRGECHAVNVASEDTRVLRDFVEEIHSLCGGSGNLEYGSFGPGEGGRALHLPVNENMKKLTRRYLEGAGLLCGGNPEDALIRNNRRYRSRTGPRMSA